VKTPTGKILWRAGKGGNIQRSADAGRTWILQTSPSQEDWLAGMAVSDKISWMVGRNGAIARTTDGGHWEKIAPPSVAADSSGKLPDWIGITAAGARKATITASDQRQYATQDADPSVFEPMREPIKQRAAAFRQRLLDTQPAHLDAVLKFADGAYRRPLTGAVPLGSTAPFP